MEKEGNLCRWARMSLIKRDAEVLLFNNHALRSRRGESLTRWKSSPKFSPEVSFLCLCLFPSAALGQNKTQTSILAQTPSVAPCTTSLSHLSVGNINLVLLSLLSFCFFLQAQMYYSAHKSIDGLIRDPAQRY